MNTGGIFLPNLRHYPSRMTAGGVPTHFACRRRAQPGNAWTMDPVGVTCWGCVNHLRQAGVLAFAPIPEFRIRAGAKAGSYFCPVETG